MTSKKILSILICLVMVLSLMPMAAFATVTGEGLNGEGSTTLKVSLANSGDIIYDGTSKVPPVNVSDGTQALRYSEDYTASYSDNVDAGQGKVTIKGLNNYAGASAEFYFTILPKPVTPTIGSVESSYNYTGNAITPAVRLFDGEKEIPTGEYSVTYGENKVDTGSVTVRDNDGGNYAIAETSKTFTITAPAKTSIEGFTVTVSGGPYTYDGNEHTPTVTVSNGTTTLTAGTDYTLSISDKINAGTHTVTVTGTGNYTGTLTGTFVINPKEVIPTLTLNPTSCEHDGKAHKPTATVTGSGTQLIENTDYTLSYTRDGAVTDDFSSVGTIVVTATAKSGGNYTFNPASASAYFTIDPKPVPITVTLNPDNAVYTGKAQAIEPIVTFNNGTSNLTLIKNTDYTVNYTRNGALTEDFTNVGTISVNVTGKEGTFYAGKTGSANFTISPKPVTAEAELSPKSYLKTGSEIKPEPQVTYEEGAEKKTLTKDVDYTLSYVNNVNAGTATVTITAKSGGNYSFNAITKTFEIIEATASNLSVTVNGGPFIYNGKAYEPSVTVKDGTTELTKDTHYTVAYSKNVNAGTATVFVSGKADTTYADRLGSASFTITPKSVTTPTIKLERTSYGYTGKEIKPAVTVYDGSTLIPATEYTVSYSNNINAGTGYATITDTNASGNYVLTQTVASFTIASNVKYNIVLGNGGCWYRGSYYGLGFRCDGPYDQFIGLAIDGQSVDRSYYAVSEGSTNVGLYPQTLNMLSNGTHYITFHYTSGSATGVFYVGSTAINAVMTGDDSNVGLLALIMCLGVLSSVATLSVLRKRKTGAR